jgi:hypothetical protein
MAQKLSNSDKVMRDTVADHARNELMKESLGRAAEIRRGLEGRKHCDSTILITEDRRPRTGHLGRTSENHSVL